MIWLWFLLAPSPSPVSCELAHRALASKLRMVMLAKDFMSQVPRAQKAWADAPESCRDGMWYAQAATALHFPEIRTLAAGGNIFRSSKEAVEAGLRAHPRAAELMAVAAYLSLLPPNACRLLTDEGDLRAYVCAAEAAQQKRWKDSLAELAKIKHEAGFPDVQSRRLQARKELGDKKRAKLKLIAPAQQDCLPFCGYNR